MTSMKREHSLSEDLIASSEQKWLELIPKVDAVAVEESETCPALQDLLEQQKDELNLYMDDEEIGMIQLFHDWLIASFLFLFLSFFIF